MSNERERERGGESEREREQESTCSIVPNTALYSSEIKGLYMDQTKIILISRLVCVCVCVLPQDQFGHNYAFILYTNQTLGR